jgi:thiamine pyrophosphate-dependent acetolactate synthase large subunit-like protein
LHVPVTALLQALWTQAREQLKVLTIICANNTYAILKASAATVAGEAFQSA